MAVLGAEDAVAVSGVAARRDTVTASEPRKRRFAERCNRRMAEPHHLLVDAAQRPSVPERVGKRCDLDRDEPVSAGSTCRGVPKPVSPGALHGNACYRVIKATLGDCRTLCEYRTVRYPCQASFRHRRTEGSPRRFRLRSADRLSLLAIEGIQGKMSAGRGPGRRREDPDELTTLVKESVPWLRDLPPLRRQPG